MATPGEIDLLAPDDKVSYQFLLENVGQDAADDFVQKKILLYQEIQDSKLIEAEKEKAKIQSQQGQPTPETYDPTMLQLTDADKQRAEGILDKATAQYRPDYFREILGITPDPLTGQIRTGIPMQEQIESRRESIPTAEDIRTQREATQANITRGFEAQGVPSQKTVVDDLYEQIKRDYENLYGPLEALTQSQQRKIESDLNQLALRRAYGFETADQQANRLISGEFGFDRPRQAGSMYSDPPTPRVMPKELGITPDVGGKLAINPDIATEYSYMVDLNPFWEGKTDFGGVMAIFESLKPQTLQTGEEVRRNEARNKDIRDEFIGNITQIAMSENADYETVSATEKLRMREPIIVRRFDEVYDKAYQMALDEYKRQKAIGDLNFTDEQIDSMAIVDAMTFMRQQRDLLLPESNLSNQRVRKQLDEKYGKAAEMQAAGMNPKTFFNMGGESALSMAQDLFTSQTPETGEITESVGMAIIRDLNLPFRMILNPAEEVVENVFMGGTSGQNVGYIDDQGKSQTSLYDVPTTDLTEEVSGFNNTIDAYLKEVAIETAKGYGTGNALANYTSVPSSNDISFVGGTLAEILVPWGAVAKGVQKGATGFGSLSRVGRALDVAADGRALVKAADAGAAPNVATALKQAGVSAPVIGRTYNTANKVAYEAAQNVAAIDAARQYMYYLSVGQPKKAMQIAKSVDELGPVSGNVFTTLINDIPISAIDEAVTTPNQQAIGIYKQLDRTLDNIGRQETIYGDIAKEIRREGRVDFEGPPTQYTDAADGSTITVPTSIAPDKTIPGYAGEIGQTGRGGATLDQLIGVGATRLAKYGIDDYVSLTDRMAINAEVFDEIGESIIDKANLRLAEMLSVNSDNAVRELPEATRKAAGINPDDVDFYDFYELFEYADGIPSQVGRKTFARDAKLQEIQQKLLNPENSGLKVTQILEPNEQVYLIDRIVEHEARGMAGTASQRGAVIDRTLDTERAFLPEQLRPERGAAPLGSKAVEKATRTTGVTEQGTQAAVGASRYVTSLFSPALAGKNITEEARRVVGMAPRGNVLEAATARRAVENAKDEVTRLERALPEATRFYASEADTPMDGIFAMYNASKQIDPTALLTRPQTPQGQTSYVQAMSRQELTKDDVSILLRTVFPTFQSDDEARIAAKLSQSPVRNAVDLEKLAIEMAEETPRLKERMLQYKGLPDTGKALIINTSKNAARTRVSEATYRNLSLLNIGVENRLASVQKAYYEEAYKLIEEGSSYDFAAGRARINDVINNEYLNSPDLAEVALLNPNLREVGEMSFNNQVIAAANGIRAQGLNLNMTPEQIKKQLVYNVQDLVLESETAGASAFADATTRQYIQELGNLYNDPIKIQFITENLQSLDPGLGAWTMKRMGLTFGDMRRSFVAGQLGGKYLPNIRYHAENVTTAPVIASVTAPGSSTMMLRNLVKMGSNTKTPGQVRTAGRLPEVMNTQMPGSRYTYQQVADGLNRYNVGSTQQTVNMSDVLAEDIRQEALRMGKDLGKNNIIGRFATNFLENFGPKSSYSSPSMKFASDVDYAFREQLFIAALQDGQTFEQAAKLAKDAFLDYGNLPSWTRGKYASSLLYFSFTYRTGAELAKALANPKGAAQVARLARAHEAMTRYYGSRNYVGDQTLQSLWLSANDADRDGFDSINLYYRDPWMGQLINAANALTYISQAAQGDPEVTATRTMNGLLDFIYVPFFDIVRDLDPDFKKGVPPKTMYRILLAQQLAGNVPKFMPEAVTPDPDSLGPGLVQSNIPLQAAPYYVDRYDLEVRPEGKVVPGSPTFNNYQYRFQTQEGYNRFYLDSLALSVVGAKRLADDATTLMIQSGYLPEGSHFGYLENGTPVMYLLGRETPMRLPKEWEAYDRQLRSQQNRLRELNKTFGEDPSIKAGDQR